MDQAEDPSEELVYDKGEQPDANDQGHCQYGCRNPFLARRPGHAPELGNDAADEISACHLLSRSFLLFVHQRITSQNWQGGQDSNLQQLVLETRTLPIELPPSTFVSGFVASARAKKMLHRVSRCGLWHRQKRQYLRSSNRSVVFCLFFCVL
jgi:hypothetical protein